MQRLLSDRSVLGGDTTAEDLRTYLRFRSWVDRRLVQLEEFYAVAG